MQVSKAMGNTPAHPPRSRRPRTVQAPVTAGIVALMLLTGCNASVDDTAPTPLASQGTPASPSVAAPPSPAPSPTHAASTPSATPTPTPTARRSTAVPANRPQNLELAVGQTARLTYFDVTLLRTAPGQDAVSHGWKVSVCHTRHHGAENADGTTRVSSDPWSAQVRDGESAQGARWVRLDDMPRDRGWVPEFREARLATGQCQTGWISVRHGNPDLQFGDVRYESADFGDTVTWRLG